MQLTLIEARERGQPRIRADLPAVERPPVRAAECTALEFGRFRVLLRQRQLLAGDAPIELGARAFNVLMALIEADGSLVAKDELLTRAWPGIVVAPDNLKVQICALRNALGENRDFIRTESGRGYRFTATVRRSVATDQGASWPDVIDAPAPREAALRIELAAIAKQLAELQEKLAEAMQMLNGRSQHDATRFRRHNYCPHPMGHASRPKHAREGRRGW